MIVLLEFLNQSSELLRRSLLRFTSLLSLLNPRSVALTCTRHLPSLPHRPTVPALCPRRPLSSPLFPPPPPFPLRRRSIVPPPSPPPPNRNSLTAVTRLRTGHIFASSPTSLPLCHTIMNEVASVARARGLSIPEDTVQRLIDKGRAAPSAGLPSSMMADCLAGRPMEVEVGPSSPRSPRLEFGAGHLS